MMVLKLQGTDIASPYRCMPRCTLSTALRACLRRSRRSLKGWKDGFYEQESCRNRNMEQKGRKGPQNSCGGERSQPKAPQHQAAPSSGRRRGGDRRSKSRPQGSSSDSDTDVTSSSGDPSYSSSESESFCTVRDCSKNWTVRRRDPRVNGADIYVARFTKSGMGSAKPCWRCLEWSRWAGVKRIFHWNAEKGKFDVVKVNSEQREQYETNSDIRLFAGADY